MASPVYDAPYGLLVGLRVVDIGIIIGIITTGGINSMLDGFAASLHGA